MGNKDLFDAFEKNLRDKLHTVSVGEYLSNIPLTSNTHVMVRFEVCGEAKKEKCALRTGENQYEDDHYYLVNEIKLKHISYGIYSKDTRFHCDIDFAPIFNEVASSFIGTKIRY